MTLSEAGSKYEMDEMIDAVRALRRMLRSAVEAAPDSAFAAQPPAEGEDCWSAGQVVAHLANSQASMSSAVRSLLDMPAAPESQRRDVDSILPTREESLATLESTATGFDAFVAAIPANADTTRTMLHQRFGEMSSKGWMLLMALHEGDHLRQIRALAD
jgi:hypothetical protein